MENNNTNIVNDIDMLNNQYNHPEYQYLNLIREIIETGIIKDDRTGVGTIGKFGAMMRFSLKDSFPLLTTKRVFWKAIVEELLWFIKGDTNANHLSEKGIKIWDGNSTREFLDNRGLHCYDEGDLGPIYGHQWRHYGAKYVDMYTNYDNQGIDQLKEVINLIKTDPNSRRIILMNWDVNVLKQMALVPCHIMCQFQVCNGELNCLMYQRSCDMGLGVPFNIASYSLLTYLIAHVTGLRPGEFIHSMGDVHVYINHIEPLKVQLERKPRDFPKLIIKCDPKDITEYTIDDLELINYKPHPKINMEMAI